MLVTNFSHCKVVISDIRDIVVTDNIRTMERVRLQLNISMEHSTVREGSRTTRTVIAVDRKGLLRNVLAASQLITVIR